MRLRSVLAFQFIRAADLVLNTLLLMLLARMLPSSEFGIYATATAVITFLGITLSWGGDEAIASSPAARLRTLVQAEYFRRGTLFAISLTLLVVSIWFKHPEFGLVLVVSAASALGSAGLASATRSASQLQSVVGVSASCVFILGALAILQPKTSIVALALLAITQLIKAILLLPKEIRGWNVTKPFKSFRPTRYRSGLLLSALSAPILGRQLGVTLAAALMVPAEQIGAYSAAYSAAYLVSTGLLMGVSALSLPALADSLEKGGKEALATAWARLVSICTALSIPALITAAVCSEEVTFLLFGDEVGSLATDYFSVFCFVLIAQRALGGGSNNAILTALRDERGLIVSVLSASIVSIIMSLTLIPVAGMYGAVAGSAASGLTMALVTLRRGRRLAQANFPTFTVSTVISISCLCALPLLILVHSLGGSQIAILLLGVVVGIVSTGLAYLFVERKGRYD
jgi:O-antigen/teichoic acid export membrane protein